ncbi:unnamed protein product [marine sediment metagenome]|uniref:Replication protein n=2 Tax=marine sediment metagenome TaxID=412755 RepID=X1PX44_9ZZZZ
MDDSSILSGPVGQRGKGSHIPRGDARRATPGAGDREDGGAAGGPLGIYAKTPSTQEVIDPLTGEITRFKLDPKSREYVEEIDPSRFRWERFAHKSVVNQLLPTSRTSKCMRWRVPNQALQVFKSQEHNKAFYAGLQVCASVWACPVCAAKISERRRAELVTALAVARSTGMQVYLLTLTVPHGLGDDLKALLEQIHKAYSKTSSGRSGQNIRKLLGLRGTVRALETTYGLNGFHPHLHVLLFLDGGLSPAAVQNAFAPLWQKACERSGLPRPSDDHGCRVDDGTYAAAYASKWGLESELTKSHTKKGRNGSRTPWDFLRAVLHKSDGWQQSAILFRTYAEAFKGKRQLYWSNGLRDLLAMGEQASDEELASVQEDSALMLADLTDEQWRAILRTKSESIVLDMAETHPEALPVLLESILQRAAKLTQKIERSDL